MNPEQFLNQKLPDLAQSEEVNAAVEKHTRLTGERVWNIPEDRLEVYLHRLEHVFLHKDDETRERNISMLRGKIHDALLTKPENIPESVFAQKQETTGESLLSMREEIINEVREKQIQSLDEWIDYLSSGDAAYPPWYKYLVFREITQLTPFDKESGHFKKRDISTTAPFPEIYPEPLGLVLDIYAQGVSGDDELIDAQAIKKNPSASFSTLYAQEVRNTSLYSHEGKENTAGEWVKYTQGDMRGAEVLARSLWHKKTGWCTAAKRASRNQIKSGDLHVYYSYDKAGAPTMPRMIIRMEGEHISEVRGILPEQELESALVGILEEKLAQFGTAETEVYKEKSEDVRHLSQIKKAIEDGEKLTHDDLIFLYEIDAPIEQFGYKTNPLIAELRSTRNTNEDIERIFECTPDEVAHDAEDITETTKVYIGPVFPGLFQKNIPHLFTAFPEGQIRVHDIHIGGKTKDEITTALDEKHINVSSYAHDLIASNKFIPLTNSEGVRLVSPSVGDLGFSGGASTKESFERAKELGLEPCPPETGPHLRLAYSGGDQLLIAMDSLASHEDDLDIFRLDRKNNESCLLAAYANDTSWWPPHQRFVFQVSENVSEKSA